jgi:hypothetical protein
MTIEEWAKDFKSYVNELQMPRDDYKGIMSYIDDALALLKEQEAVEPFHKCIGNEFSLIEDSHFDYCPYCGKPVTWAKQKGR